MRTKTDDSREFATESPIFARSLIVIVPSSDVASRLTQMTVAGVTHLSDISYNSASQVTSLKTGSGTSNPRVEGYAYEPQTGLLTGQTVKNTSLTQTYLDMTYSYSRGNSAGTNTGTEKTGQLTGIVDNLDANKNRQYEFDALGRLDKAKGGVAAGATGVTANWTQDYSYDRYGNKTGVGKSGVDANNAAIPSDGLASVSFDNATNRITNSGWAYDLAGNITYGQDGSGNWWTYQYDAAGRMTHASDGDSFSSYGYGATRERLIVSDGASSTYYAWGGNSVVCEYSAFYGQNPEYQKSYQYAGSRLLSTSSKKTSTVEITQFHHPDRLGTKLVTNAATGASFQNSTLPFGTTLPAETTGSTNRPFTTYDRSVGGDYAVNRWYSPGQSRFTTVDPIGMNAATLGNPQSNNMYAYVQNRPTDFVDPSGLNAASQGGGYSWSCYVTWRSDWDGSNFQITSVSCQTWSNGGGGLGSGGYNGGGAANGSGSQSGKQCLPGYDKLTDAQKKLVTASEYNSLGDAQKANFLNQTGILAANGINLGDATLQPNGIQPDRLLFNPDGLATFQASFAAAVGRGVYSSSRPNSGGHPGMSSSGGRETRSFNSQQIGFGTGGAFVDVDRGNPRSFPFGSIVHLLELITPGRTNPFAVGRGRGSAVVGYSCK